MIRTIVTVAYVLALALVGGGLSAHYATQHFAGFAAFEAGAWSGVAAAANNGADPYLRAFAARHGQLPLGNAEGIELIAERDSDGTPLVGSCSYRLVGSVPFSRFWTMRLENADRNRLALVPATTAHVHSGQLLRDQTGAIDIALTRRPRPGNWFELDRDNRFLIILTLYDTAFSAGTGLADMQLPAIEKTACP